MKKIFLTALCLLSFTISGRAANKVLRDYATDETGTLSSEELSMLNQKLRAFEDSTSNQLVFLMVQSLNGEEIDNLSYEIARGNKIGSKENKNGILFLVSKNDRRMRIEVGYGLEGALTDALSSYIIRNEVAPRFRQGAYYAGVNAGLDAVIKATKGEYKMKKKDRGISWFYLLPFIIFLLPIFLSRRRGFFGGPFGGGFFGGGFGGGGSFGGGDSGGFSGGGGDFGGGGSSGDW